MSQSEEIYRHYAAGDEDRRLESPKGRLEFARTCHLLSRSLASAPGRIADIGGGPGAYAEWLAQQGYEVCLVDPVQKHVDQAAARLAAHAGCSALTGDARELTFADQSMDAVLLMGPLYHLLSPVDRQQALKEALRVLKPGGILFATAISRFSYLLDGLWKRHFDDPAFVESVQTELENGHHFNPPGQSYFTAAFFHRPEELQAEARAAGFVQTEVVGIEGPAWLMPNLAEVQARDFAWPLLEILEKIEREPEMMGISTHLLVTGFRPV
ncbi:MAG TPA: class I SAM-dependent methyltransferase [Candidatus Obscuribacterales bacterium]